MNKTIGHGRIELVEGDITKQDTEAIVNAANRTLLGGGGVDGAIHRAGGPQILEECKRIGGCPTGEARITSGGRLKAEYVIHTVGPVYKDGTLGEPELLANAYWNSMKVASENGIKSLSFTPISTGLYSYPIEKPSHIALDSVKDYLNSIQDIPLVRFVLFGKPDYTVYETTLKNLS